jgi:hypothetical protein
MGVFLGCFTAAEGGEPHAQPAEEAAFDLNIGVRLPIGRRCGHRLRHERRRASGRAHIDRGRRRANLHRLLALLPLCLVLSSREQPQSYNSCTCPHGALEKSPCLSFLPQYGCQARKAFFKCNELGFSQHQVRVPLMRYGD